MGMRRRSSGTGLSVDVTCPCCLSMQSLRLHRDYFSIHLSRADEFAFDCKQSLHRDTKVLLVSLQHRFDDDPVLIFHLGEGTTIEL